MKPAIAAAVVVLAAAAAPAGQPARFELERDQVLLTVQGALGNKQLSGVSRALRGSVEEQPAGGVRILARAPVASFETGNPTLDALLAKAADADRFPTIELEAQAPAGKRNGQFTVQLEGTLTLHGVAQRVTAPLRVLHEGKTLFVKTSFPLDLAAFGLQPPTVAGMRLGTRVQVELYALLRSSTNSALVELN